MAREDEIVAAVNQAGIEASAGAERIRRNYLAAIPKALQDDLARLEKLSLERVGTKDGALKHLAEMLRVAYPLHQAITLEKTPPALKKLGKGVNASRLEIDDTATRGWAGHTVNAVFSAARKVHMWGEAIPGIAKNGATSGIFQAIGR